MVMVNIIAPFSSTAERLGEALAETVEHPDCPADLYRWLSELDSSVETTYQYLPIHFRTKFVALLSKAGEERAEENEEAEVAQYAKESAEYEAAQAEASTTPQPAVPLEVELMTLVVSGDEESLLQADVRIFELNAAEQRRVRLAIDYIETKLDEATNEWVDMPNYAQNEKLKAR